MQLDVAVIDLIVFYGVLKKKIKFTHGETKVDK